MYKGKYGLPYLLLQYLLLYLAGETQCPYGLLLQHDGEVFDRTSNDVKDIMTAHSDKDIQNDGKPLQLLLYLSLRLDICSSL